MRSLLRFNQLKISTTTDLIHGMRYSSNRLGFGIRSFVTSCRAVLLPRFGGADVLEVRDNVRVPDLKPNEVLVRARAVSVNPLDTRMRAGYGRSLFESLLPLVLGRDVSGEIAAVGGSVQTLNVGQEVFGALHPTAVRGTYADYAILAEDQLTLKPSTISHVEACAIPFAALTAWRALKSTARITEGQRVLVVGGGGAVGFSAIQLAVAAGCAVSATCESESIDRLLAAGAEQALDYTAEDLEVTLKGHYNAVLDTIGIQQTERLGINLLKRGGHYMTLQGESASLADKYGLAVGLPTATAVLLKKQLEYRLSHGIEYWWTYMRTDAEGLDEIRRLAEAGKLKVPVQKTFPITQVQEAHDAKDKRIITGKRKARSDNGDANECEMNVLTPTSSDSSITDAIAMDCEMVGVSPLGNKSALGRVTLVNKWGNVIYDEHVRPVERVVDFRTQISGIRPRDLKKAKDFRVVQKEVADLLKRRILVGHALRNDLKALLLSHPKQDIRDTAEYQPFLKEGRSKALRHLAAEVLGVNIQNGEHCPIEDARAAMMLYMKKKREWEKNVKDLVKMKLKQKKRKPKKRKKEGSLAS